jgi:hypothetical protein
MDREEAARGSRPCDPKRAQAERRTALGRGGKDMRRSSKAGTWRGSATVVRVRNRARARREGSPPVRSASASGRYARRVRPGTGKRPALSTKTRWLTSWGARSAAHKATAPPKELPTQMARSTFSSRRRSATAWAWNRGV